MITIGVLWVCLLHKAQPEGLIAVVVADIIIALAWAKAFVSVFGEL
jgi:hypothetical protein